ncbi:MAG TPA: pyridoxamine 5'-phosphate oxidase family protein [Polyangiaceae bacterium]|nr:pyridoxamine 5'-phosphate oxidase family protein [Polyangiaceae bacterium]
MTTPRRSSRIARGWTHEGSPFHAGEQAVQSIVGMRDKIERMGRNMIHEEMPELHRQLFELLPMLVVGSISASGRLWASFLTGEPGFAHALSSKLLGIQAQPLLGDPLAEQLSLGAPLGVLGIQLESRSRVRANGHIALRDAKSFTVEVEQSFGNCQQYIQAREPSFEPELVGKAGAPSKESALLSARASALLTNTDTFFIATASANASADGGRHADGEGVNISHRGGRPGFVRVIQESSATRLTIPDFRGNFMFNTLGNLQTNPRAGIVCADFARGDVLTITGTAKTIWQGPELAAFAGADRLLQFEVVSGFFLEHALPLLFQGFAASPDLAETGTWSEATRNLSPNPAQDTLATPHNSR